MFYLKYLLVFVSTLALHAQEMQFSYEYKYIPDSTNKQDVKTDVMILDVAKRQSEFFSKYRFEIDSAKVVNADKGIWYFPPLDGKSSVYDRVIKYTNSNKMDYITILWGANLIDVSQNITFKWKLLPEFIDVLGYKAQKATTEFGGRQWTAWFTTEIPLADGPYKFRGLPGLIIKVEDNTNSHVFELIGIRKVDKKFTYPTYSGDPKPFRMSDQQYIKAFKSYRKDPVRLSQFADYLDGEGKLHTAEESFREQQKIMSKRLAADNNIIEIELLKS